MTAYPIVELPGARIPENREPLGSKQKLWFRGPSKDEPRLLFKYNRPGTGEDWSEKIASELAELLGLPHSRVDLASYEGQRGAVLYDFTDNKRLPLIHGNELLDFVYPGYPTQQRHRATEHTVQAVFGVLSQPNVVLPATPLPVPGAVVNAFDLFIGYLMLDGWIGNIDRHHENWGLLWHPDRPTRGLALAPSFDHASSLGRELSDDHRTRVGNARHGPPWQRYALGAKSAFYPGGGNKQPLKTWEAFQFAASLRPEAGQAWLERLRQVAPDRVTAAVEAVPESRMSATAKAFACALLDYNAKLLGAS